VRTIEGGIRGGERARGVKVRQIMAVAYQAVTAATEGACPGYTVGSLLAANRNRQV
jgi:hypothetical protein